MVFIFLNKILICHSATFSLISGHYITMLSCTLITEREHAFNLFKMLRDNMDSLSPLNSTARLTCFTSVHSIQQS